MNANEMMGEQFEANRSHLRAVAYRMLGSLSEADDAVQEAWLRLSRSESSDIQNLGGWLTTVVARVCLDMLRSRKAKAEQSLEEEQSESVAERGTRVFGKSVAASDPEQEAILAESVGLALLVVLDTLTPAERLAFVLHDMFAVPFEEIAPIVERSPVATRQLASRARRRVQEAGPGDPPGEISRRREVVAAFLAASREGDFDALLTMLDPDIVLRADTAAAQMGADAEAIGPRAVAGIFSGRAKALRPALIDGAPGAVWTYRGETRVVFAFTFTGGTITAIEQIADPERIARFEVIPLKAGLKTQRGQLAGSSGIALARTTLA